MDEMKQDLVDYVRDVVSRAREGKVEEFELRAAVDLSNALLWDAREVGMRRLADAD